MTEILINELSTRDKWLLNNKHKMAEYARTHYNKRVQEDPEFRKLLASRTAERKRKLREAKPTKEPKVEEVKTKKANGRPRKYIIINEVNNNNT
jgi:hypothetical protein